LAAAGVRPGALESLNLQYRAEIIAKFSRWQPGRREQGGGSRPHRFPGWSGAIPEVRADLLTRPAA